MSEETVILVIDDDPNILEIEQEILQNEGFKVTTTTSGLEALSLFDLHPPSLVLLDLMLPDIDGYSIFRQIRKSSHVPVIIVTGKDKEDAIAAGLNNGADDYITKPILPKVLVARVKAVLRRHSMAGKERLPTVLEHRGLKIDLTRQIVTLEERKIDLSIMEYRLLTYLALRPGTVCSPMEITLEFWGETTDSTIHALRVNINRLRAKLDDDAKQARFIGVTYGQGYYFILSEA